VINDDLLDGDEQKQEDPSLKIIFPFGTSLDFSSKNTVSILFNSGTISYPANRPLAACCLSNSKKGKLLVLGSEKFF